MAALDVSFISYWKSNIFKNTMNCRQTGKTMRKQPLVLPSKLPFTSSVSVLSFSHLQTVITTSGLYSPGESLVGLEIPFLMTYIIEVWGGRETPAGLEWGGSTIN